MLLDKKLLSHKKYSPLVASLAKNKSTYELLKDFNLKDNASVQLIQNGRLTSFNLKREKSVQNPELCYLLGPPQLMFYNNNYFVAKHYGVSTLDKTKSLP